MPIDPEALYVQLGRLVETVPKDIGCGMESDPLPPATLQWIGRVGALIEAAGNPMDIASFRTSVAGLNLSTMRFQAVQDVVGLLYRALAAAELKAPVAARGAFIPAGNAFDAFSAIGKVLAMATQDALIIDPYMDEKALTDFAVLSPAGVSIRLLADQQHYKQTLAPAKQRWEAQHGTARPIAARLAAARTLHDRAIILDRNSAWVLTQSLNAFASRSPASIVRTDQETAELKIAAYDLIWNSATPL
jgi:hypothetical protein